MEKTTYHRSLIPALDTLIGDPEIVNPHSKRPAKAEQIIIPYGYLGHIDRFYNEPSTRGDAARELMHYLSMMRLSLSGENRRYTTDNGTNIQLWWPDGLNGSRSNTIGMPKLDPESSKAQAILCAKEVGSDVAIWTGSDRQIALAAAHNIDIARINADVYTGRRKLPLSFEQSSLWYSNHRISISEWQDMYPNEAPLRPNEFIEFDFAGKNAANQHFFDYVGRYDAKEGFIVPLKHVGHNRYGIHPLTAGQAMLHEALMMPPEELPIVLVSGIYGTGKTFLAVADGLMQTEANPNRRPIYDNIFVCPRDGNLGREIGYLPGEKYDKIIASAAPIVDNLKRVLALKGVDKEKGDNNGKTGKDGNPTTETPYQYIKKATQRYLDTYFEFEAPIFMGGRSLESCFIIYDEFQDMERNQAKAILTRIGDHSKIVAMGDPNQVTNPHMNKTSNGLAYAASKISKGNPYAAVITLTNEEIVRSTAARVIAELFE